jgi:hypothetical protein
VIKGASGQASFGNSPLAAEAFVDSVERLCATKALIVPWSGSDDLLSPFILAIWIRRDRLFPLVIYSAKNVPLGNVEAVPIDAGGLNFQDLVDEVKRVYRIDTSDAEKAYRVWQLSRGGSQGKDEATIPRTISIANAHAFVDVISRSRGTSPSPGLLQQPAPAIFESTDSVIGLKSGSIGLDSKLIVRHSAESLRRRVERLRQDATLGNLIPSTSDIFPVVINLLDRIIEGSVDDGTIVELGLELNALQWHIHESRRNLEEVTLGEITSLVSTSTLFLRRFPIWKEFAESDFSGGGPESGVAVFRMATEILQGATQYSNLLTEDAGSRIKTVLERGSGAEASPEWKEGLVRTGENLVAEGMGELGRIIASEAKEVGKQVKSEVTQQASKELTSFVRSNAVSILRLGEAREWPFVRWATELLQGLN